MINDNECIDCSSKNITKIQTKQFPNKLVEHFKCNDCGQVWINITESNSLLYTETPEEQKLKKEIPEDNALANTLLVGGVFCLIFTFFNFIIWISVLLMRKPSIVIGFLIIGILCLILSVGIKKILNLIKKVTNNWKKLYELFYNYVMFKSKTIKKRLKRNKNKQGGK